MKGGSKTSRASAAFSIALTVVLAAAGIALVAFSQVIPALLAFVAAVVAGTVALSSIVAGRIERDEPERR